jgi:hypothetical protein
MTVTGELLEYLFVAASLPGAFFIARKNIIGFYVYLVGDLLAIPFAWYYEHWAFMLLNVGYTVMNVYAILIWRKGVQDVKTVGSAEGGVDGGGPANTL